VLLFSAAKALRAISAILWPVMPVFADGLAAAFGQARPDPWTGNFDPFAGPPVAAKERPPQVARLEEKQVAKLIVAGGGGERTGPAAPETAARPGLVGYEDFARLDLRVGIVRAAAKVPKADKLLELTVDVGEGAPRTIVAGIAAAYADPAQLVDRRIVVVVNLEPRALRGITSQGMLLAAGEPPSLVTVGEGIAPGTRVR
jgi:methionyl-tRNA synthetase